MRPCRIITPLLIAGALMIGCRHAEGNTDSSPQTAPDSTAVIIPARATLLFAGDAMQHQGQLDQALLQGGGKTYNYDYCFSLIKPQIEQADYAVVNLEVPLGGGPDYTGYPCFSAPDSYAEALRDAGFDLFLTANNHCLDRGDRAARRTLTALDSLGIDHIGTYHDRQQRERLIPFIRKINGIRTGFLNYTYGTNGIEPRQGAEIALIDTTAIRSEIELTRQQGAEIIVVAMHWGIEYVLLQNREQERLADFLAREGVDLIIGGHPHVIQPMKIIDNPATGRKTLIVYSLGNFISNMKTNDTRGGALVRAVIERDSTGNAGLVSADYDTFITQRPSGAATNYRVVPSLLIDSLPAAQRNYWTLFNTAAQRVFDKHNVGVPRRAVR